MTNEVANVFGGAVSLSGNSAFAEKMAESSQKNPRSGGPGDSEFLNFSGKRGVYELGADKESVDPDELWVVNAMGFEDGWICWKGGRPVATLLANFADVPVKQPDADEHGPFNSGAGEGWFQMKTMTLKSVDGGVQAYFKINSISGVSVFAELQGAVAKRAMAKEPGWPVVTLGTEDFTSGSYKNYKPVLTVQGWLSDEQVAEALTEDADVEAMMAENDEPVEAPKPKKRKRRTL